MAASILFALPILALTATPAHAHTTACEGHRHVSAQAPEVLEFTAAVNRYLELHRLLEDPMSSLTVGTDSEQTARAREAHRNAIVEARVAGSRGDVFTPTVAAYMRRQIQVATHHPWMADAGMKAIALQRLPRLPHELEYRFVERDLVLLDTEIDVVVDVLENALPPDTAVTGSPCAVHPDLVMCWS
jgi:hypothetical protein